MSNLPDYPRITVITAVYNRRNTIREALESVLSQDYRNVDYVVVDGNSRDGTTEIIREYADQISTLIVEPDDGIYDALNKGLKVAKGDVVGFLHADDLLASPHVLSILAAEFRREQVDAVYGGLYYVAAEQAERVIRYWPSVPFRRSRFRWGWMPPHPSLYISRACYERYGLYNRTMSISADYELIVRMMVKHQIRVSSVPDVLVKMRVGGKSNASWKNRLLANREDAQAWRMNDLRPPWGLRLSKPARKLLQYFNRPTPSH